MPNPEERERSEGTDFNQARHGGAALPTGYLDDVFRVAAIYRTLGGLEKLFDGLGAANKSNTEKIEDLTRRVYAIPYIKKDIAQSTRGLNQLEKQHNRDLKELEKKVNGLGVRLDNRITELRTKDIGDLNNLAHTGRRLFRIGVGVVATLFTVLGPPVVIYLYRHFSLSFKP